jgi:hypothetical protein
MVHAKSGPKKRRGPRAFRPCLEALEGRALPSFVAPPAFPAGPDPSGLTGGDFNGDGRFDVVAANGPNPGQVSLLLNDGAGGFLPAKTFPAGSSANSVAAADVNQDGSLDLVVTNPATRSISVLRGSGTGQYRRPVSYPAGSGLTSIAVADFTADGFPDVAVLNAGQQVSVLVNAGNGAFLPPVTYNVGTNVKAIATGDFNGDGRADLVAAGYQLGTCGDKTCPTNPRVTVFLSNGDGTFTVGASFDVYSSPGSVVTGDFNNDGRLDLVTADTFPLVPYQAQNIIVQLGNGDGTFQAPMYQNIGTGTVGLNVADMDVDGKLDLVVRGNNSYLPSVGVLRGKGDGTFLPPTAGTFVYAGKSPVDLAVGDVTGDGFPDVAVANGKEGANGVGTVMRLPGDGKGGLVDQQLQPYRGYGYPAAVADFNGDGMPDFAEPAEVAGDVSVYTGIGNDAFTLLGGFPAGKQPSILQAADFNGDGRPDLVATDPSGAGSVTVLLNQGGGQFPQFTSYAVGANPNGLAAADLNGDGHPDLVVTYSGGLAVLLNAGDGTFLSPVVYDAGPVPRGVVAADFNGDSVPDLAAPNQNAGTVSVLLGKGNGSFGSGVAYPAGAPLLTGLAAADLNGDGRQDLVVVNSVGAGTVSVLLGNGDGSFQPPQSVPVGAFPLSVATGDFNRDGKADLAVTNSGSGTVTVLLGDGHGSFPIASTFAVANILNGLTVSDLNGDGFPELLVAGDGGIYIMFNDAQWPPAPPGGWMSGRRALLAAAPPAGDKTLLVFGFPSPVTAGTVHTFTVTAKDVFGNVATGYQGTVHFTSSGTKAILPEDYTFSPGDGGARVFGAVLTTVGTQDLTATDTAHATLTGAQAGIMVLSPPQPPAAPLARGQLVSANSQGKKGPVLQPLVGGGDGADRASGAPHILVYDDNTHNHRAQKALAAMGLSYRVANSSTFNDRLARGTWDLVVVDCPSDVPLDSTGQWRPLADYVNRGGRAIMSFWDLDNSSGYGNPALGPAFEVSATSSFDFPMTVYHWPRSRHGLSDWSNDWADDGDQLFVESGAYAVAGFFPVQNNRGAAIVVGNGGRTIYNGFLFDELNDPAGTGLIAKEIKTVLGMGGGGGPNDFGRSTAEKQAAMLGSAASPSTVSPRFVFSALPSARPVASVQNDHGTECQKTTPRPNAYRPPGVRVKDDSLFSGWDCIVAQ